MTKKNKSISTTLFLLLFPALLFAQENDVEMADVMRANGKIYVVVAVLSVILAGLLIFILSIDRRVRRMEKGNKENK